MSADPISAALMVASSVLGGFEKRRAYRAQAAVSDENARLSELAGEQQAQQTRHDERALAGEAIAAMGESGFALGTGTALDLIQQSALQREIEIGNIRAQAQGEAHNHRMAAHDARRAAKGAFIEGLIGGAAAGLDFASASSARGKMSAIADSERKYRLGTSYGGGSKGLQQAPGAPYQRIGTGTPFRRLRVLGPPSN